MTPHFVHDVVALIALVPGNISVSREEGSLSVILRSPMLRLVNHAALVVLRAYYVSMMVLKNIAAWLVRFPAHVPKDIVVAPERSMPAAKSQPLLRSVNLVKRERCAQEIMNVSPYLIESSTIALIIVKSSVALHLWSVMEREKRLDVSILPTLVNSAKNASLRRVISLRLAVLSPSPVREIEIESAVQKTVVSMYPVLMVLVA